MNLKKGSANQLYKKWEQTCKDGLRKASHQLFRANIKKMVHDFDQLPLSNVLKTTRWSRGRNFGEVSSNRK